MSDFPEWMRRRVATRLARDRYRRDVAHMSKQFVESEDVYVEHAWNSFLPYTDAALAEILEIIGERAGPGWGISTRLSLGTETARMSGIVALTELLADAPEGDKP